MNRVPAAFWSLQPSELFQQLQAAPQGLTSEEAGQRLMQFAANAAIAPCDYQHQSVPWRQSNGLGESDCEAAGIY